MDKKLANIITRNNYSSIMNTTKWKEIVAVLKNIPNYNPNVNIKLLIDDKNNGLYNPVWWSEIECDGFEYIEWLKISPIKKTYIGRLVEDKKENFSELIKNSLDKFSIQYEMENEIFVIYGYYKN